MTINLYSSEEAGTIRPRETRKETNRRRARQDLDSQDMATFETSRNWCLRAGEAVMFWARTSLFGKDPDLVSNGLAVGYRDQAFIFIIFCFSEINNLF